MLIRLLHWGWCICFIKIKEANSEILRIILALLTMAPVGVSNATVAKLATDLSNTTTRQRSSPQTTGLTALSRRDGDASDWPSSRDPSQDVFSLVGPSCRVTPSRDPIQDVFSLVGPSCRVPPRKLDTDRSLFFYRNR